jgi:hypothetical protein
MDEKDEIMAMLVAYEETLRQLKDSDRLSDEAPQTFGDLAAKIRAVIERRVTADRHAVSRDDSDTTEGQ